jgi:hypothetical protein
MYQPFNGTGRRQRVGLGERQLGLSIELADQAVVEVVPRSRVRGADARPSATVVHAVVDLVRSVLARRDVVHAVARQGNCAITYQHEAGGPPTQAKRQGPIHGDIGAIDVQKQRDCYLSPFRCQELIRDENTTVHDNASTVSALSRAARASYNDAMTNTCGRATHRGPSPGRTFP